MADVPVHEDHQSEENPSEPTLPSTSDSISGDLIEFPAEKPVADAVDEALAVDEPTVAFEPVLDEVASEEAPAVVAEAEAVSAEAAEQVAAVEAEPQAVEAEPQAVEAEAATAPELAAAPAQEPLENLPEDLRALAAVLEQPTGELMALPGAAAEAGAEPAAAAEIAEAAEGEVAGAAEGAEPAATGSLDDIAPGTVADAEAATAEEAEPVIAGPRAHVAWWPFAAYVAIWIAGAAYVVSQLRFVLNGQGVYETELYRTAMIAGLGMLAAGPVLLLVVWISTWIAKRDNARPGSMFISALWQGSLATFVGALIWIVAIMVIDYLRFGRAF